MGAAFPMGKELTGLLLESIQVPFVTFLAVSHLNISA